MKITIALVLCVLVGLITAQSQVSYLKPKSRKVALKKTLKTIVLPEVNVKKQLEEESKERGLAPRFGFEHMRSESIDNSGLSEELKDGSRIWRLSYQAKGAFFTTIAFDEFYLAPGATLHVIDKFGGVKGAYTQANNRVSRQFGIAPIKGDAFIVELYEPKGSVGLSKIKVRSVTHAYKDLFGKTKNNRSGTCNINVACPQGQGWEGQIASVGLLLQSSGFRFCTGSFVNNLNNDGKQLFLTAAHCGSNPSFWVVGLNYQSDVCQRGRIFDVEETVSNLRTVARYTVTDVHLIEVEEPISPQANIYLAGWNAVDEPERGQSCGIHHPSGDVKKISFARVPLTGDSWGRGPANTHWRVARWSEGTTEPGSSGSPLYDSNKRVIGQLHGGTASCRNTNGWDSYGKIAQSFDRSTRSNERLKETLDPNNTGIRVSDGIWLNDARK